MFNFDDVMPLEKLYEGRDSRKDETRQGDVENIFLKEIISSFVRFINILDLDDFKHMYLNSLIIIFHSSIVN